MSATILLWVVFALMPPRANSEPLPWAVGDAVAPRWTVARIARTSEFVRLELVGPDGAHTGLEVVPAPAAAGPFDTARYRVQAALGESPPVPLVESVVARLRTLEALPGHLPFVEVLFKVDRPADEGAADLPLAGRAGLSRASFAALAFLGACALLGMVLGVFWLRRRGPPTDPRHPVVSTAWVGLAGLTAIAASAVLLSPLDLPLDLLTGLHEGGTQRNVYRQYAYGIHAGPLFEPLLVLLRDGSGVSLRNLVFMNAHLEALAVLGFLLMGRQLFGTWPRAVFGALVWSTQLPVLHAAFSELPAALLHVIAVLAMPAAVLLASRTPVSRGLRVAALAQLLLCASLFVCLRGELAVVAAPAVVIAAACALGRRDLLDRASVALGRTARRLFARPRSLGLVALLVVALGILESLRSTTRFDAMGLPFRMMMAAAGLSPFNLSFLAMPIYTLRLVAPGIVGLSVVGAVAGLRSWVSTLGISYAAIVLWRVHFRAAHESSVEELLRYSTYAWPVIVVLALSGWHVLSGWIERRVSSPRMRRALAGLMAMALVLPGPLLDRGGPDGAPYSSLDTALVSRNVQVETRALVDLVERHPSCVFVTRTVSSENVFDHDDGFTYLAFGGPLSQPVVLLQTPVPTPFGELPGVPDSGCRMLYQGFDCNRLTYADCGRESHGLEPVWEQSFAARPYTALRHSGGYRANIHLALFLVPSPSP